MRTYLRSSERELLERPRPSINPPILRYVETFDGVPVFQCVEHNHGDLPQFYAAGRGGIYGPAATIAAAASLVGRT